ncbi:hypothetical protein [Variovorax sp. OK605]|uniref:hypothetical protein n=1 Tax=Variovorax sp. OK605 TaxID=1855317 RepID=UPI0011601484|nr:hypothetical protein [Variovorax sp. OK605]
MIAVAAVQSPEGAPNGAYFACKALRATLSKSGCADRWRAALPGSACYGCPIGRQHQPASAGSSAPPPQERRLTTCQRCGRSDLRIVHERGICISCYNRQRELIRGRNGKGFPPQKMQPLAEFSVATESAEGTITHHHVDARHLAEAAGVVAHARLRRLPIGERLSEKRPGPSIWSKSKGRFVVACPACSHAGLLERRKHDTLHHHCPGCEGRPHGPGWALAVARAPMMLLDVGGLHAWLAATKEELPPNRWNSTGFGCVHCRRGVLQALGAEDAGILVRCPACGEQVT